jgi:hypothetical protein
MYSACGSRGVVVVVPVVGVVVVRVVVGNVIVVSAPNGPFAARTPALNSPAERQASVAPPIRTPRLIGPQCRENAC